MFFNFFIKTLARCLFSIKKLEHYFSSHVSDAIIILVGTKVDLRSSEFEKMKLAKVGKKTVSLEDIKKVQKTCKIEHYFESSSKTQQGITELFDSVMEIYLKDQDSKNSNENTQNKCCCLLM